MQNKPPQRPVNRVRWLISALGLLASLLVGVLIASRDNLTLFASAGVGSGTPPIASATVSHQGTPVATAKPSGQVPAWDHVVVILMENRGYREVIGQPRTAPYLNALASQSAVAANYQAVSTAGSLAEYLALTAGDTYGVPGECLPANCVVRVTNLADRLEQAGKTWKAYQESMPGPCWLNDSYPYGTWHNPFIYYADIQNNSSRCAAHDVPYTQLATDFQNASTTPNYSFITPNLLDDMHDGSVSQGDTWLAQNVPSIINSPAFTTQHSLLMITWDEDDHSSYGPVATVFFGYGVRVGHSHVAYTHYSLLRTIERAWGLEPMAANDGHAAAMTDLLV